MPPPPPPSHDGLPERVQLGGAPAETPFAAHELDRLGKAELNALAPRFDITAPLRMKKLDLIARILEVQAQRNGFEEASGILDILPDGYGFLRRNGYVASADDIYISVSQIRRFELRAGDLVSGLTRKPKDNERFSGIVKVHAVDGRDPETLRGRRSFERLTPVYPDERYSLEVRASQLSTRLIDLFAPLGKGQRALIVAPPKTGKTTLLKQIANAIAVNHPQAHLIALLVDERPEEVTDMQRTIRGEVIASTFDEHPERHASVAELALERAKRLVESGLDVVILLDSITRLARAYNHITPASGRTLSGGLDTASLHKPKRFFGAARKIEEGGSLTIVATALVETGSKMDEIIFEEFKGTGNMELTLSRKLSESRVFPAVDVKRSGTRHEELLLGEIELRKVWMLRRATSVLAASDLTELVLERMAQTKTNDEFLQTVTKEALSLGR